MDSRKKTGEKVEDYFVRLRRRGKKIGIHATSQGVSRADVEMVLKKIDRLTDDMRDSVWCLLDNGFPSLFPNAGDLKLSHGATVAHIGGYVGILLRGKKKLDREGRDYWLKPLRELGAIAPVSYDSENKKFIAGHVRPKSPNNGYRLHNSFVDLLRAARTDRFDQLFDKWISDGRERLRVLRESQKIAAESVGLGAHEKLIAQSVDVYAKYFLPSYTVLFLDYSDGKRISDDQWHQLEEAGVKIGLGDVWPDVILHNPATNSLWFIEAGTTG